MAATLTNERRTAFPRGDAAPPGHRAADTPVSSRPDLRRGPLGLRCPPRGGEGVRGVAESGAREVGRRGKAGVGVGRTGGGRPQGGKGWRPGRPRGGEALTPPRRQPCARAGPHLDVKVGGVEAAGCDQPSLGCPQVLLHQLPGSLHQELAVTLGRHDPGGVGPRAAEVVYLPALETPPPPPLPRGRLLRMSRLADPGKCSVFCEQPPPVLPL